MKNFDSFESKLTQEVIDWFYSTNIDEPSIEDVVTKIRLELLFDNPVSVLESEANDFKTDSKYYRTVFSKMYEDDTVRLCPNNFADEKYPNTIGCTSPKQRKININDKIFKRESIQLRIKERFEVFKKTSPRSDIRIFFYSNIEFIDSIIKRYCPNESKSSDLSQLNFWLVLNDYKKELNLFLEDQTVTNESIVSDQVEIDCSELKSIGDKILYLHETGVLDLLREKYPRLKVTNQLAILLSRIIGEELTSIQPVLYAFVKNDASNKNYPTGILDVRKVIKQLE